MLTVGPGARSPRAQGCVVGVRPPTAVISPLLRREADGRFALLKEEADGRLALLKEEAAGHGFALLREEAAVYRKGKPSE
jgi:hypothetical protein